MAYMDQACFNAPFNPIQDLSFDEIDLIGGANALSNLGYAVGGAVGGAGLGAVLTGAALAGPAGWAIGAGALILTAAYLNDD